MNWSPRSIQAIRGRRPRSSNSKNRDHQSSAASTLSTSSATWLTPSARAMTSVWQERLEESTHGRDVHALDARPERTGHGIAVLHERGEDQPARLALEEQLARHAVARVRAE